MPLFVGSVEEASDGWMYWLLDSGAACSVLAEQNKECYRRVSRGRDVSGRYLAANGTPVEMGEKVLASVLFAVERSDGTQDSQEFQLECNIGQTAHNIISTTQLMKKGWTFVQSNSGSFLVHEPTKTFIGEVLYWGSCPWIRVASDGQQAGVPKTRALDFQSHRPHQPMHQRWSPRVGGQRRLRQRFHLQVSQFLQSLSRMSQRIMIASWRLAKLVLVAAELIRT